MSPRLNYSEAAKYLSFTAPRSRRFRRDMLDLFLTNRDVAMRLFHQEREKTHGR